MMTTPAYTDAEAYAIFLRAIGHRVVQTASAHWYDVSRLFYLSAPAHRTYVPTDQEIRGVLRRLPCLGVRFAAPLNGGGKLSYQIVCDNQAYDLEALSANARSKIRRGLKRCEVGPVSFSVLATAGEQAQHDTVTRQARARSWAPNRWRQFCTAAAATPGFEGWGAWTGETLAAFLVTVTFDDSVEFLLARSRDDQLGAYPNNALLFHVTTEMLARRHAPEITFGLESLEPVGPLDQFKFSMGFRTRPLRQRVVFHPLLRGLLRHAAVRSIVRRWTQRQGNEAAFWRKAAGLLRFAEEGGL